MLQVWEEQDHMKPEDFDPKVFFKLHGKLVSQFDILGIEMFSFYSFRVILFFQISEEYLLQVPAIFFITGNGVNFLFQFLVVAEFHVF